MTTKDCSVHLVGALYDLKEAEEQAKLLAEKIKAIREATANKTLTKEQIYAEVTAASRLSVEQSSNRILSRLITDAAAAKRVDDILFDRYTGERAQHAGQVSSNWWKTLTGKGGIDSKLRATRDRLDATLRRAEQTFGMRADPAEKVRYISDMEKGSDFEKQVAIRVQQIEGDIDLDDLTPANVARLMREHGQDQVGRTALAIKAYNAAERRLLVEAGYPVKFAQGFVTHKSFDRSIVKSMSRDEFIASELPRLDKSKSFGTESDDYAKKALGEMYDSLLKKDADLQLVPVGDRFVKREPHQRELFYNSPENWYESFNQFSVASVGEAINTSTRFTAATAVRVGEYGLDQRAFVELVDKRVAEAGLREMTPVQNIKYKYDMARIKLADRELAGMSDPVKSGLSTFVNTGRKAISIMKLGGALPTAMLDMFSNNMTAFYMNGEMFGGVKEYIASFGEQLFKMNAEQRREFVSYMGGTMTYLTQAEAFRMGDMSGGADAVSRKIDKVGDFAMKYSTFLPQQTSLSQAASMNTGAILFSRMLGERLEGKANKFRDEAFSKDYKFTDAELDFLTTQVGRRKTWGGDALHLGNLVDAINEANPVKLAQALNADPKYLDQAVTALYDKVGMFLTDSKQMGTPAPELRTTSSMFKNTDHEIARLAISVATQFLDTPIAQAQNYKDVMSKVARLSESKSELAVLGMGNAAFYVMGGATAYLAFEGLFSFAMGRKSLIQQYNEGDSDRRRQIMARAIDRAAPVPFLAEMVEKQFFGRYNENALDAFGSPMLSVLNDTVSFAKPGGLTLEQFAKRQLPRNAIPVQMLNNWVIDRSNNPVF